MTAPTHAPASGYTEVELAIGGMTCASCAARVEKRLNRLDGVTASVNYATEHARVTVFEGTSPHVLIAQVEGAGYTASIPEAVVGRRGRDAGGGGTDAADDGGSTGSLRTRLLLSAVLTIPVIALAMVPALQFDAWQWLSLTLAAPVVVWGGRPSTVRPGPTCTMAPPPWTR